MSNQSQNEKLDWIVKELCIDSVKYKDLKVRIEDRRNIMHSLMNIRMPKPISQEFIEIQDEFLKQESVEKGIITIDNIPTIQEEYHSTHPYAEKISLWQGDITRLQVDAIVNAANAQMLGCFVPGHSCIDNAIHSAAGIELREECYEYMRRRRNEDKNYEEPTGSAILTKGYNLPCKHVIHTVGPIVYSKLTEAIKGDLRNCYNSCLQIAVDHGIKTIAFCCISTGEFRFPNEEAAKIAMKSIQEFLDRNAEKVDRIIINVFKNVDLEIYKELIVK
ncbi:MAG: protein-ADP-ribose hydrolase [Mobilitalea sp.]